MIILIPAYEPDEKLLDLVAALDEAGGAVHVVVVNDGSGPGYEQLFAQARLLGARVIGYPNNHGKGQALKTGFGYIAAHFPGQDVVCADSDGQHGVPDILRVAAAVRSTQAMVLGERRFDGEVPLRSRIGNGATRLFFGLATGARLHDTQTGLRGYPARLLPWLQSIHGDRYEYELNLLLEARQQGIPMESITIATIYLQHNESSHFRPLQDSLRIYAPLVKFSLSSLGGFAVDLALFLVLNAATGSLLLAVAGARAVSAGVNFAINRTLVFPEGRTTPLGRSAVRYLALVLLLMGANYCLLFALTEAGLPALPAKLLTEIGLFLASFALQKRFLFRRIRPPAAEKQHSQGRLPAGTDSAQTRLEI
ncbi:bifunctional glycosyltransferase family 2/GtrA family protein [Arthrobacter sp. 35W]|uniref:bifunctional glycosyltransferase family 2/GtrA family protein n=1 Tax=Arthrobacter sp. 35W TaxID=1132441 RepID=UPI00041CE84A|nr:bifunctional glycosyltransferase family 2/GtrA family protein [Arthrobacter sp. 35W]